MKTSSWTQALKPYYLDVPAILADRTFINPPFDFLEPWMHVFAERHEAVRDNRIVQLVPVRPHRVWWTRYAAGANGVWLAAFPFVGSKACFPGPIALLARNCVIPPLGKRETGRFCL